MIRTAQLQTPGSGLARGVSSANSTMEVGREAVVWHLQDKFKQYKQKGKLYDVRIDESGLTVSSEEDGMLCKRKTQVLKASDLAGCVCMKAGVQESRTHLAYFTLYAYPLSENKKKRTRLTLTFEVDKEDTFEKNLEIANTWRSAVHAVRNFGTAKPQTDRSKKLLVFVNPKSGPGKAHQIYKKQVASIFGEAEITHEVVLTERANHALDMVKYIDLDQYSGIIIVSGDGLLYEVYNGLLMRPDWEKAIQFPIGIIPGGSGNGLARSVAHWLNEPYMADPVLVSALNIIYGHLSPLDLVLVHTSEGKKILSFLSIGFGLLADIDIESERLRSIGESRFVVWSAARVANLRKYHASISFRRIRDMTSNHVLKVISPLERSMTVQEEPEAASEAHPDSLSRSQSFSPEMEKPNGASLDLSSSLIKIDSKSSGESCETENGSRQAYPHKDEQSRQGKLEDDSEGDNEDYRTTNGYSLPDLDKPVPDDWETIEDKFILVYACYQSHLASNVQLAPKATPNDGCMWLVVMRGTASKSNVAKFLLGLDGSHINVPGVEMIPVDALRIVPSGNSGYLNVDGEVIPWGPVQLHVLPGKGQIITR
ncbi:sphingosine kinase 1-like [Panulirus ornatus]|uniref:sphingosine kinase 1-like n=1 Tax=Panulirus ornatus TaxID=150431 RepID=UPI003A88344F